MTSGNSKSSNGRSWGRTLELAVFCLLVAIGATTIVSVGWARDYAKPRVTLLGADRGISALVTSGSARVLILNGTDSTTLGNAITRSRHPGLDRLDLMIVSGNTAASGLVPKAIELLNPRGVMTVGSTASLNGTDIVPIKVIERSTEIELPHGVMITVDIWPAADGENDDATWSARISRGGASVYLVSDREDLMQESMPERLDVTVIGRGAPADDTPFPITNAIIVAGESISGPELRDIASGSLGPDVTTKRVFAGESLRIDLDPTGIRSVSGAVPAGSPTPA
ncbi:MAG: hypothetical protein R2835_00265 [Thermomicrobiales bacterium]